MTGGRGRGFESFNPHPIDIDSYMRQAYPERSLERYPILKRGKSGPTVDSKTTSLTDFIETDLTSTPLTAQERGASSFRDYKREVIEFKQKYLKSCEKLDASTLKRRHELLAQKLDHINKVIEGRLWRFKKHDERTFLVNERDETLIKINITAQLLGLDANTYADEE